MQEILEPIANVLPEKYAGQIALLLALSQVLGRAFHALRKGGGLKAMFDSIWLGTNTPRANPPGQKDDPNQTRLFTALLCVGLSLAIGCTTVQRSRLETKAFAVTRLVVKLYLESHPEYRAGFLAARDELQVVATSETMGLEELMKIIDRLPPLKDNSGRTQLYVETGILFFSDDLGAIAVDNPAAARQAAAGMVRAIDAVLSLTR